jgi:TolB-like protein
MSDYSMRRGASRGALVALAFCATACASAGSGTITTTPSARDSVAMAGELAGGSVSSSAIGIPPFQVLAESNTYSALGYALADLLTTDLSRSANVSLVERSRLNEVVRELDLAKSGRVDSSSAPRVGKLLRAKQLVLGSIDTMTQGELRLSVRLADVETGALESAVDARAPLADILAAEKALAFRLLDALGITLSPAERREIEAYATTSIPALNAYGRGVQATMLGDHRRAADAFEQAFQVDPSFAMASQRAQSIRTDMRSNASAPSVNPGMRAINQPIHGTVDRVNRPLDILTSLSRPLGGPGDPSFPSTLVTVIITVSRP